MNICGIYTRKLFRNEKSGFTIFSLRPNIFKDAAQKMKNGLIICKGILPDYDTKVSLMLEGEFTSSDRGWSFDFCDFKEQGYDRIVTESYLSEVCGLSKTQTYLFINKYGVDPFVITEINGIEKQLSVMGFGKKADKLLNIIRTTKVKRELMSYLQDKGMSMTAVNKLSSFYGKDALVELKKNPYQVGYNVGLTLECCDLIAIDQKMNFFSQNRIHYYVQETMERQKMSGNVYVSESEILPSIRDAMNKSVKSGNQISLDTLAWKVHQNENFVVNNSDENNKVYMRYLKKAEDNLAYQICRLQRCAQKTNYTDDYLRYAESIAGFEFAPEQRSAFNLLKKTGIGILTGGPGTGKTTTVKGIIDAYEKMYPDKIIKLCAPTGRAAQRMTESTGRPSQTIHRLLEYKPFEGEITCKDDMNPIIADFIIVDEVSMLDLELASLFFTAVQSGCLVIFVGDINQLQSVGAGDVLNDLINCGYIPVERLIKTYRQASDSYIIKNATAINYGHDYLSQNDDFIVKNSDSITKSVCETIRDYHNPAEPFYAQVLSPAHMGDGGVSEINKALQNSLNPTASKRIVYGSNEFRLNDKILMTKNNIEKGYFNGDVGVIVDIGDSVIVVDIQDEKINLEQNNFDDLKLAYAMTIHKSQGSEFPVTIISLPHTTMLRRNLLYTAVTRAKKKVVIIQNNGAISEAVKRNDVGKRHTTLVQRLQEQFGG